MAVSTAILIKDVCVLYDTLYSDSFWTKFQFGLKTYRLVITLFYQESYSIHLIY